ncbi:hypothetical protein SprV_0301191600 [Sparganum proliferum]
MPYSIEDNVLFAGQQSSIQAESVDTGFYSPYSRSTLERADYRKAHYSATGGSTLEFPTRDTESVNRSGNDRLRRGHLSSQIRNSSLQSWKQPALQSGAVTSADAFAASVMERRSNSRERKSVLDSYASELPPPIPPPRDISRVLPIDGHMMLNGTVITDRGLISECSMVRRRAPVFCPFTVAHFWFGIDTALWLVDRWRDMHLPLTHTSHIQ